MKQLRRTIREILQESKDACDQLNDMLQGAINQMVERDIEIVYYEGRSNMQIVFKYVETGKTCGILKTTSDSSKLEAECWGGSMVEWAKVDDELKGTGLGALMYDVALELIGTDGLMADRFSVSDDAIRNWNYFKQSNDYWKKPLDNIAGEYTPDKDYDDCADGSWLDHGGSGDDNKEKFQSHPLNNVVVKKDQGKPTYRCLHGIGRIRERD